MIHFVADDVPILDQVWIRLQCLGLSTCCQSSHSALSKVLVEREDLQSNPLVNPHRQSGTVIPVRSLSCSCRTARSELDPLSIVVFVNRS